MEIVLYLVYLVASVLFILGIKKLSSPKTARRGNQLSAAGMLLAIVVTLFDQNILTFNPGWDQEGNTLPSFTDVRDLQKALISQGLPIMQAADESTTGPASFIIIDPDGNPIMVDQHV